MVKHTTFGHAAPTARALSKQVMDVMDYCREPNIYARPLATEASCRGLP